ERETDFQRYFHCSLKIDFPFLIKVLVHRTLPRFPHYMLVFQRYFQCLYCMFD
ncbi:hypothetical protein Goshw_019358, partial [Gossypium schwendimanii]|nr:hypothetical protein [Gossypium schwendimanii]